VHHEPAALDGALHACAALGRVAPAFEEERPVDLLDVDAAILQGLNGAGDLDDTARGFLGSP
jgi:hypothetical protein